uniref:Uncharacterized protein n=1 Tax=Octopus bimaculoides TaxID=37653 RepID=A0A0L8H9F8_OCTBM
MDVLIMKINKMLVYNHLMRVDTTIEDTDVIICSPSITDYVRPRQNTPLYLLS